MVEILSSTTVHCGHMLLNCRWSWPWRSFMCLTCEYLLCVTWEYFISDLINLLSQMLSTPSNELWDLPLEGGDTNRAKHKQLLKTQCFNSNTAFFCFCFLDIFSSTYWFGISFFYQSITSNACICSVCVCVCVCVSVCVCASICLYMCVRACVVCMCVGCTCASNCVCVCSWVCVCDEMHTSVGLWKHPRLLWDGASNNLPLFYLCCGQTLCIFHLLIPSSVHFPLSLLKTPNPCLFMH